MEAEILPALPSGDDDSDRNELPTSVLRFDRAGDCADLTQDRWAKVHYVLSGDSDDGVSLRHAAAFAGVRPKDVMAWISRSRKRLADDEDWIYEIADFYDNWMKDSQSGTMEDVVWRKAKQEGDTRSAMSILTARDERYQKKEKQQAEAVVSIDEEGLDKIFTALDAAVKMRNVEQLEAKGKTIDVMPKGRKT